MRTAAVLVLPILVLVAPISAQILGNYTFVPVLARTTGAGDPPTFWISDVTLHNPMGHAVTVGLKLFPGDQANSWPYPFLFDRTLVLGVRETVILEDVLGDFFALTGNVKASLLVVVAQEMIPSNPEDTVILVASRTYNTGDPAGTYGQSVPGVNAMWNGDPLPSFVTGIRQDSRYRSNLGLVNGSFEAVRIHYRFFRGRAQIVASGSIDLPPLSLYQWSLSSLGVPDQNGPLSADLWLDPSDVTPNPCEVFWPNKFAAYISKVDGNPTGTGDAEFLLASPTLVPPPENRCPDD